MTVYTPPIAEMRFVLERQCDLRQLARLPGLDHAQPDLVAQVLEEAGRLASEVWAPLNRVGDREGARLENGVVTMPTGFEVAWRRFVEGGWNALPFPIEDGGQGLPFAVSLAAQEMWHAANLALGLCPLLTQAGIEALLHHAEPGLRARALPPLMSGRWTGTMSMTEPQAGSDVGAIRTRAVRAGDHWRLFGTKIFLTFGEHELSENILHLVLARTEGAPDGTRGLSLFVVPKYLIGPDGRPGARNDLRTLSLEHKLGIHASPTCVMAFGENDGAIAHLVGEELGGMRCMFTMMNQARIGVGVQGLGLAERAFQAARAFAHERIQGRRDGRPVPIAAHADVRRMLLSMQVQVAVMRALVYEAGAAMDRAAREPSPEARRRAHNRVDLLTPVVKAWCTDHAVEVASLAVQVHGGMGFIEETGAAQLYRDARILPIYEGTNGIQAMDLAGRKLRIEDGRLPWELIEDLSEDVEVLAAAGVDDLAATLRTALDALAAATCRLQSRADDTDGIGAAAAAYLELTGATVGAVLLARASAADDNRLSQARFFATRHLAPALALSGAIEAGAAGLDVPLRET